MAAETWAIVGDGRTEAENTLNVSGFPVVSHNITPANWNDLQMGEFLRVCEAAHCKVKYTKAATPTAAEVWTIKGNARGRVESRLTELGYAVASHNITLPSSGYSHSQVLEILRVIRAGGCRLAYTKATP